MLQIKVTSNYQRFFSIAARITRVSMLKDVPSALNQSDHNICYK